MIQHDNIQRKSLPFSALAAFAALFLTLLHFSMAPTGTAQASAPSQIKTPHTQKETGIVRIGLYENPPKIFTDENGLPAGFWPDILRHIASTEGWQIEWIPGTWPENLAKLANNSIDILPDTAWTEQRSRRYAFNRETVLLSWSRLYISEGSTIDSIIALEGKTVGALKDSSNLVGPDGFRSLITSFEIDCRIIEMSDYKEVFKALEAGEIDAGITNKDFGNLLERNYDVKRTSIVFQPVRLLFALTEDAPKTAQLIEALDRNIRTLKKNNDTIYHQALDRWIGSPAAKQTTPTWLIWLLVSIVLACVLLGLGTLLLKAKVRAKTRQLEREVESRKLAEQQERQAKTEWRQIFECIGHPLMILNSDHEILSANHATINATGLEEKELIGKKCYEVFHRRDSTPKGCPASQAKESGLFEHGPMEFQALNGTYMVTCTSMVDETTGSSKIIHMATDITERKTAEHRLESSERQLRAMLENIELIAIMLDNEGNLIFSNHYFLELTGWEKKDILHRNWFTTFIPEESREELRSLLLPDSVQPESFPAHHQNEILLKNSDRRVIKWSNTRYIDEENDSVILTAIGEDITDFLASQQALRTSQRRFRELVETINDIVFATDRDGTITYISPRIETMTGYSPADIIGRPLMDFVAREDATSIDSHLSASEKGIIHPSEFRFLTTSGNAVWVRSSSRPIFQNGQFYGLRGIMSNISETRELENKLLQAQKMESIGTLAGGIAHDFNNILAAVIGYTELSLHDVQVGTTLHDNLSEVLEAGYRAKNLTKQILSISRHEEQEMKPVQINPLLKEAMKMLRSTLPSSIDIRERICRQPLVVRADPTQLHQVIVNLVTNAMHAIKEREGLIEVCLDTKVFDASVEFQYPSLTSGSYAELIISDTGEGIEERYLDKIFEPYFTTKKRGEGTGLGLSVVHTIVTAHGGHITAYSQPGIGTTFYVYLPLTKKTYSSSQKIEEAPLSKGHEHILLVDDEPPIVKMQCISLERLGYTVTSFTSPVEALEAFRADPANIDLVITDMTMPAITGDKLAAAVKATRPDVPVIIITGFSEKLQGRNTLEAIDGVLMKPVDKVKMAGMLRELLDN